MPDCMLAPPVHERGAWIKRVVGFPLRQHAPVVPGFSTAGAQGMRGGELPECPGTVLPGSCACSEVMDAAYACLALQPTCRTVVVYVQGTDGCSRQVAVLSGDSPTTHNSFVAPSVYSLVKVDSKPAMQTAVLSSQGSIILPTSAEQAGGGNGTQAGAARYQGCILVKDAVADGKVAATLDGVVSAEDCCRACRARNDTVCNVWSWCPADQAGGCTLAGDGLSEGVSLSAGQCELQFQDAVDPSIAWSLHLLSRNTGLPFVAGAPLDLTSQQLQPLAGYVQHLGLSGAGFAPLACPEESIKPYLNVCVLPADRIPGFCSSRSDCAGFVIKQGLGLAGVAAGQPVANASQLFRFNPSTVLYLRDDMSRLSAGERSDGGSGGLSGGAIAGIAVAAAAVAVAAACVAVFAAQRRRRQRGAESGEQPVPPERRQSSLSVLPPALRDWVVDLKDLKFLRHADGTLQELGSGASGVVHKALWHGEVIAAKSIDVGRSPGAREAFITEAMRLHQLRHAHMVALYGVALSGSTGVLLLEYCAGRDLMSALPVEVAGFPGERLFGWYRRGRRIALEITKAINFLHAKSVVHMDIKSSNVLLTGMGVAKLADVGLARLQTGTFLSDLPLTGTFAWVAPEILMGGCRCTSAVDIYSLGVVLWEVVTGERPMWGQLRIPQVPEECPQDICNLILQCLSLDPSQRPTAQQAMRQLTPRSSK
ncbi:hypothetical protein ABPG75_010931 [Micractinium tetrahymenae]